MFRSLQIDFIRSTVVIKCPPKKIRQKPKNSVDKLENALYNEFRFRGKPKSNKREFSKN